MDWDRKTIKVSAMALACAVLIRLVGVGALEAAIHGLASPEVMSFVLFLETGRLVKPAGLELPTQPQLSTQPTAPTEPEQTVSQETEPQVQPTEPQQAVAVFSVSDAELVEVNSVCGYDADVKEYLAQDLSWDLTQEAPTVLIVHSHATESYENTENYSESSNYRTRDTEYNMVSVGDRLVQVLEAAGIQAIHDRSLHDSPSYSDSYGNARESIRSYLEQYPSIRLVLDIHRDAVEDSRGDQMKFTVEKDGQSAARLMMVVGTDAGGLTHPDWPENMSLAVKLHAQLEKNTPGICRPISFRSQRFNQDLSPGALIVEVGAAGNTRQEALLSVELLGQAVCDIAAGANLQQ